MFTGRRPRAFQVFGCVARPVYYRGIAWRKIKLFSATLCDLCV